MQISSQEGEIKLFDVKSNPSLFLGGGLAGLLQSQDIVKVKLENCLNILVLKHGHVQFHFLDLQLYK